MQFSVDGEVIRKEKIVSECRHQTDSTWHINVIDSNALIRFGVLIGRIYWND